MRSLAYRTFVMQKHAVCNLLCRYPWSNKAQRLDRSFQSGSLNILSATVHAGQVATTSGKHKGANKVKQGMVSKIFNINIIPSKRHTLADVQEILYPPPKKKIKKHTRLVRSCHMVNSESLIQCWNFAWMPRNMTHSIWLTGSWRQTTHAR